MSADGEFNNQGAALHSPAANAFAITPSDSDDLERFTRGIYVGGAGDVEIDLVQSGEAIVFSSVAAGSIIPVRAKRVRDANTTATNLVGLY